MKRIFLLSIIALIVINLRLYAQEETTQTEPKLRLKVVYEKTFQDTIVDVIFDTVTVSITKAKAMGWKEEAFDEEERVKGKATISYPKVIFYGTPETPIKGKVKEIRFLREDGKIFKVLKLGSNEDVIKSHSGNYILIRKSAYEDNPYSNWGVYTIEGKVVLEKKGEYGIVPVDISDDGYVVGLKYPMFPGGSFGNGFIYGVKGNEIARVKNPLIVDEGWASAKFSDDGVIFGFSDLKRNSVIKFVRKNGKVEWERKIPLTSYFLLRSDKELGIVCIFNDNKIKPYQIYAYCIGWDGTVKWRTPLEIGGVVDIEFKQSNHEIFISSCAGYLWNIDALSGRILWKYKEYWAPDIHAKSWPNDVPRFRDIALFGDELIVKGRPYGRNKFSKLFFFDNKGNKLLITHNYLRIIYLQLYRGKIFIVSEKILHGIRIKKDMQK